MFRACFCRLAKSVALTVIASVYLSGPGGTIRAGEISVDEDIRTIDKVQIFKADGKSDEYYYLPTDIRFALDDKGEPAFFLLKYNQPIDVLYEVSGADGTKKTGRSQGGILAMEVSYTLSEEKRVEIEKKLREATKNPAARLALLPLDEASISLEYVDPATATVRVKTAAETAPLSGNTFPFLVALSKDATDIMWDAFSKPASTAILNAKIAFKYTGYTAPLKVTVRGNWENVFKHESWNLKAQGGFWFFSAKADISRVFEQMQQDGTLKVQWKGGASPDAQKMVDRLTDSIIPAMFDTNFGPPPEPAHAEKAGGFFGGVSFAYKSVEKLRKGNFLFDYERKEKVTRSDARGSRFSDIDKLSEKESVSRHFRVVDPTNWDLIAPRVSVNVDMKKYDSVSVALKYGNENPAPIQFDATNAGKRFVPREWKPNEGLPKEERFVYEYAIEAQVKDGAYPANVLTQTTFKKDWTKTDKPFLKLSPADWKGPQQLRLEVGPMVGFQDKDVKRATVKVSWNNDGEPVSKTFYFAAGKEVVDQTTGKVVGKIGGDSQGVWEPYLVFEPGTKPKYTAEVSYTDAKGNRHGPFQIKQGDKGADADHLAILLDELE